VHTLLTEVQIARQPILTSDLRTAGWELLHRGAALAAGTADAGSIATAQVLVDGLMDLGRQLSSDDETVYINVPEQMLHQGVVLDLPTEGIVLEVLEDLEDLPGLRAVLERHRRAGFRLALDDVVPDDPRLALLDLVEVVKVDLLAVPEAEALQLIRRLSGQGHCVLAEKIETSEAFERSIAAGATLAQGYFLARPEGLQGFRTSGISTNHVELLRAVRSDELDLRELERLIRSDLSVSDRFLRLVHATMGWRNIDSVHHGLVMLGDRAIKQWVSLLAISSMVVGAPPELLRMAALRAHTCETIQRLRGRDGHLEAFSLGMFSILGDDGRLPPTLVEQLPVTDEVAAALCGEPGEYLDLLSIPLATEAADWDRRMVAASRLGLTSDTVESVYRNALAWSRSLGRSHPTRAQDPDLTA